MAQAVRVTVNVRFRNGDKTGKRLNRMKMTVFVCVEYQPLTSYWKRVHRSGGLIV